MATYSAFYKRNGFKILPRLALQCFILMTLLIFTGPSFGAESETSGLTFEIRAFALTGNTLFSQEILQDRIKNFVGKDRTTADVENARSAIEAHYHENGYPTALVNIPEQTVDDGIVRLEVIESKIRRVRMTGNRFFTMQKILEQLPSLRPGEILYVPRIQAELAQVNRNPDMKVAPILMPGKELGTIDIELRVKDKLPLHGYAELNNRSSHSTTDLRFNAMLRYDNLWQRDHSVSVQYQTTPRDPDEVKAVSGSYTLPAPWDEDQLLSLYGVQSDSDTALEGDFKVVGKGSIAGFRNVFPLPGLKGFYHSAVVGADYKKFDEDTKFGDEDGLSTPVTYLPLSIDYSATQVDGRGSTLFNAGINAAFRGLVTQPQEFEEKRYKSRGNYAYVRLGVERTQNLPFECGLRLGADGQIADQPLISNEQYTAGGMESVHGYKESEAAGDDGFHLKTELFSPDFMKLLFKKDWLGLRLHGFYEYASLKRQDPLPGEKEYTELQGIGARVSGFLSDHLSYKVDYGQALKGTEDTQAGDWIIYFAVRLQF